MSLIFFEQYDIIGVIMKNDIITIIAIVKGGSL
jgi:hypothetical protein